MSPKRKLFVTGFLAFITLMMAYDFLFDVENFPFGPQKMYAYRVRAGSFRQFRAYFVRADGTEASLANHDSFLEPFDPERLNNLLDNMFEEANGAEKVNDLVKTLFHTYRKRAIEDDGKAEFHGLRLYREYWPDLAAVRAQIRSRELLYEAR